MLAVSLILRSFVQRRLVTSRWL